MRLVSWNVNGLRAVHKRGDLQWAFAGPSAVDVLCLQETKIQADALTPTMTAPPGYRSCFSIGIRKGYSGTAIFVRDGIDWQERRFLIGGDDHPDYDQEGRICAIDIDGPQPITLINVYFPNGGSRLEFKHAWHEAFSAALSSLAQQRTVLVCGDVNIAHRDIDVARPQEWQGISGLLPVERQWLSSLLASGYVDSLRAIKGDVARQYSFWETRIDARRDNLGWRIDYWFVPVAWEERLLDAWLSPQIFGSDHCPVGIELEGTFTSNTEVHQHHDAFEEEEDLEDDEDDAPRRR
jgi:exodeoxyribonuclease III